MKIIYNNECAKYLDASKLSFEIEARFLVIVTNFFVQKDSRTLRCIFATVFTASKRNRLIERN